MRVWVTVSLLSLQASLSLADDIPEPVTHSDFPVPGATSVLLGRDLFYDPLLSGNRNIACASCHHPTLGSADGVALSIGEGGHGLGPARSALPDNTPHNRIPRNAPALFNKGAFEFTTLFHDGRVMADPDVRMGMYMPEGFMLERPVPSALAAQAILPILSPEEMAGQPGENDIANAVAQDRIQGLGGAWHLIAARVEATPDYRRRFDWLIGQDEPVHITDIGRALADFITYEFRATDSPFDAFLRGDDAALDNDQTRGMALFYGKAQCSSCHSGPFQTDHQFHSLGIPQIGPGKGHGPGYADHGRAGVTGDPADLYAFRTPSLRNVALTAPYSHSGAYPTLRAMIEHHLDPLGSLAEFDPARVALAPLAPDIPDSAAMDDYDEVLAIGMTATIDLPPLSDRDIDALIAFLHALTDTTPLTNRLGIPDTVPSGLPLDPIPPS